LRFENIVASFEIAILIPELRTVSHIVKLRIEFSEVILEFLCLANVDLFRVRKVLFHVSVLVTILTHILQIRCPEILQGFRQSIKQNILRFPSAILRGVTFEVSVCVTKLVVVFGIMLLV
jgi:hypothetical protein